MPDSRDELDRLLDSALATYADPGADSGLEHRILSRIASEAAPAPRRRWLVWAIALPAAACLLLLVLLSRPGLHHSSSGNQEQAQRVQQPAIAAGRSAAQPAHRSAPLERADASVHKYSPHRTTLAAGPAPLPKQDIFPMPRPLSPQEQALVNFAAHATRSERESLLAPHEGLNAPLHFAEIHIEPLEPPAEGANN